MSFISLFAKFLYAECRTLNVVMLSVVAPWSMHAMNTCTLYFAKVISYAYTMLIKPATGTNVTRLFTAVSYECLNNLVHLPFKPSLMFAGKTGAYLSEGPFRYSTLG